MALIKTKDHYIDGAPRDVWINPDAISLVIVGLRQNQHGKFVPTGLVQVYCNGSEAPVHLFTKEFQRLLDRGYIREVLTI